MPDTAVMSNMISAQNILYVNNAGPLTDSIDLIPHRLAFYNLAFDVFLDR